MSNTVNDKLEIKKKFKLYINGGTFIVRITESSRWTAFDNMAMQMIY